MKNVSLVASDEPDRRNRDLADYARQQSFEHGTATMKKLA